jgi:hypothetical protein
MIKTAGCPRLHLSGIQAVSLTRLYDIPALLVLFMRRGKFPVPLRGGRRR